MATKNPYSGGGRLNGSLAGNFAAIWSVIDKGGAMSGSEASAAMVKASRNRKLNPYSFANLAAEMVKQGGLCFAGYRIDGTPIYSTTPARPGTASASFVRAASRYNLMRAAESH
jgi:hypothetical protein